MSLAIDPVIGFASRLLIVLVFGGAALHKLRAHREFVGVLRNYRLLPGAWVDASAAVLVGIEVFVALGVWASDLRGLALAAAVVLLVAYSTAIAVNLWRGRREIDCGCSFGTAGQPLSPTLLLRNALLVVPCVAAGLPQSGQIAGLGVVVAFLGAATFGLCYHTWGVLLANRPRVLQLADR